MVFEVYFSNERFRGRRTGCRKADSPFDCLPRDTKHTFLSRLPPRPPTFASVMRWPSISMLPVALLFLLGFSPVLAAVAPRQGIFCYIFFLSFSQLKSVPSVPSAASFYVPTLPDLHQDDTHPLKIFAGHLASVPNAYGTPSTEVTPHLYFVLVKARKTADKERILFWFNVSLYSLL